jgi:hypothetical protein
MKRKLKALKVRVKRKKSREKARHLRIQRILKMAKEEANLQGKPWKKVDRNRSRKRRNLEAKLIQSKENNQYLQTRKGKKVNKQLRKPSKVPNSNSRSCHNLRIEKVRKENK